MNDDYDIPISVNDTIISLSAQIEGLKKTKRQFAPKLYLLR